MTFLNPRVWRFFNIGIVLLILWNIPDMFSIKSKESCRILTFLLFLCIPLESLYSAGWIATTTNYLWILALGLISMRPLKHWLLQEPLARWEYLCVPLCMFYAANMEQMTMILFIAYLMVGAILIYRKKHISSFYFILLGIVVLSLIFILSTPGNWVRVEIETEKWFPEFATLSFLEKAIMGVLVTGRYYFTASGEQVCYLVGILSIILLLETIMQYNLKNTQDSCKKILGIICVIVPVSAFWLIGQLGYHLLKTGILTRGRNVVGLFGMNDKLAQWSNYSYLMIVLQLMFYVVIFFCYIGSIYCIHGKSDETAFEITLMVVGLMSKAMIGFSPTVYISGDRTALFCSVAFMILIERNIEKIFITSRTKMQNQRKE